MATVLKATSARLASSARTPSRSGAAVCPRQLTVRAPRSVVVRSQSADQDDPSAKLQEQLNQAVNFVKEKWDATEDSEKPAAVAIIIGAVVAQIVIGATVDAVDHLPFIQQFLEFVGLAVTGVYGYRYLTEPSEREAVKKNIDNFIAAVTGDKKL